MNTALCPAASASGWPPCTEGSSRGVCDVERCTYAIRIFDSIHLIRLGARVSLAEKLTGLEKKTLKRIYRQLRGCPSPPGQLPFSDAWFLENDQRQFHTTLVWHLHRRLSQSGRRPARILVDVFEVYTRLTREPMLNLTRTAFAIQLFSSGLWNEHRCSFCDTAFPAPVESRQTACPGCRLYFRYRCRHCGAALSPKSRGIRRKRCPQCGGALD